jgi:multidrug transporter EmrE-like cation transporter
MNNTIWIIIATIIAILPIFFIKQYNITNNSMYIILSLLSYIFLTICYINLLNNNEISTIYVILQILQILIVSILSIILFQENISVNKIIGIIFGCLTIYYLSITNK